eukprot:GHVL01021434.1.p1 GENE.GHVL01021434.1~~GHVL01021434.1.p1  ORF type:complete len:267 (-),score=57.00 GHVL01021434.1:767-1567(-)
MFPTFMESEYRCDMFADRGLLLGGFFAMSKCLFEYFLKRYSSEEAYYYAVEHIVGDISSIISTDGLLALFEKIENKKEFEKAYSATYTPLLKVLIECYEEIAKEINFLKNSASLDPIAVPDMEAASETVRSIMMKGGCCENINPTTAGIYVALMIAQYDVLISAGHSGIETVNKTIIQAVDSLNPYIKHLGMFHILNNSSKISNIGLHRWWPRFENIFKDVFSKIHHRANENLLNEFKNHEIHFILKQCNSLKSKDIVSNILYSIK